jgi:glycosyltransferase involved in cell wall biosynthesis
VASSGGPPITVGYDEQVFLAQQRGGISRYVVSLVQAYRDDPTLGVDVRQGWRRSTNDHSNDAGLSRPLPWVDRLGGPVQAHQVAYLVANTAARRRARRADVLHHTYFHPRFWAARSPARHVCTVYDMIPELFPESFPTRDPHLAKRSYVARSEMVFCISESAKRDLVEIYGDPGVPMPVTYLGVGPEFTPGLPRPAGLPERYVVFVGRRGGYKDYDVLVRAFADLPDEDTMLLVVGGGAFNDDELAQQRRLGVAERIRRTDVADDALPALYANALAFVFPSRHEGFGLPTLEAMAAGIPVVLADASSHPEVGGDVARYFPAGDDEALRKVLAELLGDDELRQRLGREGTARAAGFSWARTAQATAQGYRALLGR